ncbi:hypothetical protein HAX54_016469, partial [Datura stramonium]|nr:hypothetical protein [Datura stramonium]
CRAMPENSLLMLNSCARWAAKAVAMSDRPMRRRPAYRIHGVPHSLDARPFPQEVYVCDEAVLC